MDAEKIQRMEEREETEERSFSGEKSELRGVKLKNIKNPTKWI